MAVRKLGSRYAAERLIAILVLGFLKDAQSQPALLEQLLHGSSQTALHAGRALLEIDANRHAVTVVQALLARDDLDFSLASILLKPFRGALAGAMDPAMPHGLSQGATVPGAAADALPWLRLARALSLQVSSGLLAPFLAQPHDIEILIAAIRLVQGERGTDALSAHARHEDWRVRTQVAQALGRIGGSRDVDLLVRMATDAQWWVRYRAIQALLRIPGLDAARAQSLVEDTGDRYAVDMLHAVLSENEVAA